MGRALPSLEPGLLDVAESLESRVQSAGHELLSLVFESLGDALFVTDASGRVILINRAAERLIGHRLAEQAPRAWREIADVYLCDEVTPLPADQDPISAALSGKPVADCEHFIRTTAAPAGIFVSVTSRALSDSAGRIMGSAMLVRDVTTIKNAQRTLERANAELKKAQQERAELSALLVHDLKSPLQSIIMNARYLINSAEDGATERDCLRDVLSAADTMHRMVLDLLDLSISEDGGLRAQRSEVDIVDLLEEVRESLAVRARDQGQRIVTSVLLERRTISADRELLRRTLQNLLDNCIKYGPVGGTIRAEAGSFEGGVEFRVSDDGPGIPDSMRSAVFEKYGRIDADTRAIRAGSRGLGLRFCWLAVRAHDGQIWVEDHVPHGACFCVRIPA